MAVDLEQRFRTIEAERGLRRQGRTIFQQQRRPEIVLSQNIIVPDNCGHPQYDFYLSARKGQPCWDGPNVFDSAQELYDNVLAFAGGNTPRAFTVWVDPLAVGDYGDMICTTQGTLDEFVVSFSTIPGGSINTATRAATIDRIHLSSVSYIVLDFKNMAINSIDLSNPTGVAWLNVEGCRVGPIRGLPLSDFSEFKISGHETWFDSIILTDDVTNLNSGNLIDGNFNNCVIDGGFVISTIVDIQVSNTDIGWMVFGDFNSCDFQGIRGTGSSTEGGIVAWMHILHKFSESGLSNVTYQRAASDLAPIDALVNMELAAIGINDNKLLTMANCGLSHLEGGSSPAWNDIYLLRNGGAEPGRLISMMGNVNVSTQAKGATGPFTNSTFGPNCPNSLDYSGVTGAGNKIWQ